MRPGNLSGLDDRFPGIGDRGGAGSASLPGLGPARPGQGGAGERFPGLNPGQGGAGQRWNPSDRGTIPERHQDMANRFDDLQNHWGDSDWHHDQWNGPNGGDVNHFGYWGPNGYWGHTGVSGPNGGYWGHTGAVGPNGAWGHAGYYGPAGHWSRNWGWYNGYCPAWGHCNWNYLWGNYPAAMAFGLTTWGINCTAWSMGIGSYYNPYYVAPVYVDNQAVVSYDQPIVGDPNSAAQQAPADDSSGGSDPVTDGFNAARQAFQSGDYDQALQLTNQVLKLAPRDAAVNEFRSLCLFALGQYQESAATIHAVLAAGPGWDWTTMISLYGDPETYTQQLRNLETATKANPEVAANHFLLGYHYLTGTHKDAAVQQWQQVVELQPKDKLTAELVQMYAPPPADNAAAPQTPAPQLDKPAYPLEQLEGAWTASNSTGQFGLTLGDDDKFTWKFTRNDQVQTVTGVYIVRGNNLVMQPDAGGTMAATIELKDNQTLAFTPVGDAQKLTFTR